MKLTFNFVKLFAEENGCILEKRERGFRYEYWAKNDCSVICSSNLLEEVLRDLIYYKTFGAF